MQSHYPDAKRVSYFSLGRALEDSEWEELKEWKKNNPSLRLRQGCRRDDGMIFVDYIKRCVNGEHWLAKPDFEALKERRRLQSARWRKTNPERYKHLSKKSYAKHATERRKGLKRYRENNKDKLREANRSWQINNRARVREYMNNYVKTKYHSDPLFRLTTRLRGRIRDAFRYNGYSKRSKSGEILGATFEELKSHIESQFKDGMCWERYSEIHIDHVIPLSSAKTPEELTSLCHYTNLRPMWGSDNMRKGGAKRILDKIIQNP